MQGLISDNSELNQLVRNVANKNVRDREVLSSWMLSRVERIYLEDGSTLIVKLSREPLTDEGRILDALRKSDIPLPDLYFAHNEGDLLKMVMEDLGPMKRLPMIEEIASFAVLTHTTPPPSKIPVLDERTLQNFIPNSLKALETLSHAHRWHDIDRVRESMERVKEAAVELSRGVNTPPFGLCHSEFYPPKSLHVGSHKTGLVDWARAFLGPGLLDLASVETTITSANPQSCRRIIEAYVRAGGAPEAAYPRVGLRAEIWALFWHRLWVVEWFISSCATWMDDTKQDEVYQQSVERFLNEAYSLTMDRRRGN